MWLTCSAWKAGPFSQIGQMRTSIKSVKMWVLLMASGEWHITLWITETLCCLTTHWLMPHRGLRVGVLSVGHTDPQNSHISSSDAISKEWISEVMYLMLSSFKESLWRGKWTVPSKSSQEYPSTTKSLTDPFRLFHEVTFLLQVQKKCGNIAMSMAWWCLEDFLAGKKYTYPSGHTGRIRLQAALSWC